MHRVAVTGLSILCPVGNSPEESFQNLLHGQSGIGPMPDWPHALGVRIAGQVKNFSPENWIKPTKDIRRMDRFMQLGVVAGTQAWQNAQLPDILDPERSLRAGVLVGVGFTGIHSFIDSYETLKTKGPDRVSPFFIPSVLSNLIPGHLAIRHQLKGPNWTPVSACASGAHAIGEAFRHIRDDRADIMLAGGAESALHPLVAAGFHAMRALCADSNHHPEAASRPFDAKRSGFVLGEGAGMLVLERLDLAEKRGARILAELTGYGSTGDAYHITTPSENAEGAQRAMQEALDMAKLQPEQIDYVNAHGTSTPYNDRSETLAIKAVFKSHARKLAISSTKSMTGHLLGAAGGVEAVFTVLSILHSQIPPTINLEHPDPECDLDYVPNKAREQPVRAALSNSFGFGGTNAALLFQEYRQCALRPC